MAKKKTKKSPHIFWLLGIFALLIAIFVTNSLKENVLGTTTSSHQTTLSQSQLQKMAGNKYANGNLPLGDNKYTKTSPKVGYVYLCNVMTGVEGGAQGSEPWIHGSSWNYKEKVSVTGSVKWKNSFTNSISGSSRTLSGNDLPSHTTGIFPIQSTDPAYTYDKNPNSIKTQSFKDILPAHPTYSNTPYCMGGEAGVMLSGVALFNGFDAGYRDAPAYEVQDSCSGHPQKNGEYHYHSLSSCITDVSETTVIGFALDGFPITGPKVATNKYLTTSNLDECHGITSQITLDGKKVTMYHYVMTQDFPYSVSCFRGKPAQMQVISSGQGGSKSPTGSGSSTSRPTPPQGAYSSCTGKTTGTSCSFAAPNGTIIGTCQTPPGQSTTVCVPTNAPR